MGFFSKAKLKKKRREQPVEMVKRRQPVKMRPHFFKIVLNPHASELHIPDAFVMKYGANLRDHVFLEVPSGVIWEIKLQNSNGMAWLKEGWNKFKEYYSIGFGYCLLFQYNGNSHFSVFIFGLSATEIEYPSGPNEDIIPENFVNIVGDARHKKKAGGPEAQNIACDDIMNDILRNKTGKVTKVADRLCSTSQKCGIPVSRPCLAEWQDPNTVKLEKPDVEEDLNCAPRKDKRKEIKEKLKKQNMDKNLYCAADQGNGLSKHCNEVLDPSASKMTNTTKCNKRKYSISLEASHCRYPLRSRKMKLVKQSKEKGSPSYSGRHKTVSPLYYPTFQSERKESNRVKLEKANPKEDFYFAVPQAIREETNMEKLEKQDMQHNLYGEAYKFREHCNEVPDSSTSKMTITNQREKKTTTSMDASYCRYPLHSRQLKEVKLGKPDTEMVIFCAEEKAKREEANNVKLVKGDVEGHRNVGTVVDPSISKVTTTTQHSKKKITTSLDASNCRYPLRSKQLKGMKLEKPDTVDNFFCAAEKEKRKETNNVKLEVGDVKGHRNDGTVVDLSISKVTTTNQHSKKRITTSLDASNCRYPLRSKKLKGMKLEKSDTVDNLFCAAEKEKRKETNNVMLEVGDVKGHRNDGTVVDLSISKVTTTNQHSKKRITTSLDASNCRYPLRSKKLKGMKLEKSDTVDNLFCAAEKEKRKETNNVKLEIGDVEEHCNEIPVVDFSATKVTTTNRHDEKESSTSVVVSQYRYPLRSKQVKEVEVEKPDAEDDFFSATQKAKRKKANNVKLEKGDLEERCNEIPVGDPSATKITTTNRHIEKRTSTSLDASHCRYPLRSKQLKEVKLEQWEARGNMHNKNSKNKVVADSPYCKRQNYVLPAPSPSCQPIRVKLEKPDSIENLFCAVEKEKRKETNNVKLVIGDVEGNLNSAAYKGKDSTASEMTNTWQEKGVTLRKTQCSILGYPYFIVFMQPSYVSRNFQLDIPFNFFKRYFKGEEPIVNLRVPDGRTWRAKCFIQPNCAKIQSPGWRDFVLSNNLKENDACVFELIEGIEPVLLVSIF